MSEGIEVDDRIAIVGMAGRFPGAATLDEFWSMLREGREAIRPLSVEELVAAGESMDRINDPAYVAYGAPLEGIDLFDAGLFGLSPRDAAVFDPQHRLFLECAYETFEHAGYRSDRLEGAVAVFASCGASEYMYKNVLANAETAEAVGEWLIRHTGNDTNFLATRVSYEFDLDGPSLNVQTACSSTLVAIHLACQSILSGESDMALAGGAVVAPDQVRGYMYKEGEILSPDGHCRPFDAASAGTVITSAAGCVLLRPLADAIDAGDNVLAVIRGSAINNDGRQKVGYLAPSVSGQARVVTEALTVAGVDARDVSYVETHGTGTLIGDPIEVAGLSQAFRGFSDDKNFCAIGSLKSNIGHTGEAAGVAALIKTVLSLVHREIPPSLHFETPNPQAFLEDSPFYVNAALQTWEAKPGQPRLAGVTALGAGGTNAHLIIEEAPQLAATTSSTDIADQPQVITLSTQSESAMAQATDELSVWLSAHPDVNVADVAFTRWEGRRRYRVNRAIVASTTDELVALLENPGDRRVVTAASPTSKVSAAFMLPGGGAQYPGMGLGLYEEEPVFRSVVDECCDFINPQLDVDLRELLTGRTQAADAEAQLRRPSVSLPAMFTIELATARLFESWGVVPSATIGHSAGEYAAACLSGVFSMFDGLALVALRGRLFETVAAGSMLSVALSETETRSLIPDGVDIAAVNTATSCVCSGPAEKIDELRQALDARDIDCAPIHIDVAAHSAMLDPILAEFGAFCDTIHFAAPSRPFVSNVTGTWITDAEATDSRYWVRHLRQTVRFADGMKTLTEDPSRFFLEIGPGRTLTSFARSAGVSSSNTTPTIRHPKEEASDVAVALHALAAAWASGAEADLGARLDVAARRRVPMPHYPFERRRYWIDPDLDSVVRPRGAGALRKRADIDSWFAVPTWRRSAALADVVPTEPGTSGASVVLIVGEDLPIVNQTCAEFVARGRRVLRVRFGAGFRAIDDGHFTVDPALNSSWDELLAFFRSSDCMPDEVVHMSGVGARRGARRFGRTDPIVAYERAVQSDYASLLFLARALSSVARPIRMAIVTSCVAKVDGRGGPIYPERALLHGAARVIPRELGHVDVVAIDIGDVAESRKVDPSIAPSIVREVSQSTLDDPVVAYRGADRFVRDLDQIPLASRSAATWEPGGVVLITGGLGGIGRSIGLRVAESAPGAKIMLIGRNGLPPETDWPSLLSDPSTSVAMSDRIRSVQKMQSAGATVQVIPADVTSIESMRPVIARILAAYRRVDTVIHAAGILRDALIAFRTPTPKSAVIDVKAKGILVLDHVLASQPPRRIVMCSSVSSILGLPGQVDYTAGNAFLDAYAAMASNEDGPETVSVNWNAWQEVGMAVEASQALVDRNQHEVAGAGSSGSAQFFDSIEQSGSVMTARAAMSRSTHWLLSEHVVRDGDALIPGTGFLELMRKTVAAESGGDAVVRLQNAFFLERFAVGDDETRELAVTSDRSDGSITIFAESKSNPCATSTGSIGATEPRPTIDIADVQRSCDRRTDRYDGYSDQEFVDFGPRWGCLRQIDYGDGEALVSLSVPSEFHDELADFWLHPAVLDIATGSAQALAPGFDQASMFFVPLSYGSVTSFGPISPTAFSHVRLRPSSARDIIVFDVTVYDSEGVASVDISGFTMRRVDGGTAFASVRRTQSVRRRVEDESAIDAALREAICPDEGVEALDRLLASHVGAQVVVSSVDVQAWSDDVDRTSRPDDHANDRESSSLRFDRPDIGVEFEAPQTSIETELAGMWCELLGIETVGRHDDFFDLGGQSLIAVRLFSRLRQRYEVDLALSILFEAPTVAQCAQVIADHLGIVDEPSTSDEPAVADAAGAGGERTPTDGSASNPDQRRVTTPKAFQALVTIQKGTERGSSMRSPFFCVHGAGGNVLNFRDLSIAMGRSQPFYGVQSHGIDGVSRPKTSIEEMATSYLSEVQAVQPEGPYVFGGYSGGGLVAFEMARQVTDAGHDVALLVLLDTFPPKFDPAPVSMRSKLTRVRNERFKYLKKIVTRRLAVRERAKRQARLAEILASDGVVPTELREMHIEDNFGAIASGYERRPWTGNVMLLRAESVAFAFEHLGDSYGWNDVIDGVFEVVPVSGNHDTLVLEPNATTLAKKIAEVLLEAGGK